MNKLLSIAGVSQLMLLSSVAYGDYQSKVSIGYDRGEVEELSTDAGKVGLAFYLEPVITGGLPLGESAFIARASHIDLHYGETTNDEFDSVKTLEGALGGEYFGKGVPLYFSVDYMRTEVDTDGFEEEVQEQLDEVDSDDDDANASNAIAALQEAVEDFETASMTVAGGVLIGKGLLVGGKWNRWSVDGAYDLDTVGPMVKYVAMFGSGMAINLEGDVGVVRLKHDDTDEEGDGSTVRAAVDLYLNRQVSIGAAYQHSEIEEIENTASTLRAQVFFNENLSLAAAYTQTEVDLGPALDKETYSLTLAYRFGVGRSLLATPDSPNAPQRNEATPTEAADSDNGEGSLACQGKYKHLFGVCP